MAENNVSTNAEA